MIHVTCAVIQRGEWYLICQRSEFMKLPLKWEFPGGKVEEGESLENCLIREIREEIGVDIQILKELPQIIHHYETFSLTLYPFLCEIEQGEIILNEHAQFRWIKMSEFELFDLAEADIPIIKHL